MSQHDGMVIVLGTLVAVGLIIAVGYIFLTRPAAADAKIAGSGSGSGRDAGDVALRATGGALAGIGAALAGT